MAKSCFALHDAGALGGSFLSFWGGRDFLQGAAVALGLFVECDSLLMPYTCAEIPPAGAPSGFDSAAMIGFGVHRCNVVPLRSERHSEYVVS